MNVEQENLSESDVKVRQMLGALNKVEAPKDFDFRLKARIANSDPRVYQTSGKRRRLAYWLPAPALAAALVAGFYYGNVKSGDETIASGEQTPVRTEQAIIPLPPVVAPTVVAQTTPAPVIYTPEPKTGEAKLARIVEKNSAAETFVKSPIETRKVKTIAPKSSDDKAASIAPNIQQKDTVNSPDNPTEEFSGSQVFQTLGVETTMEDGKLKVKSIKPKSPAASSGLSVDDVIESVNGENLAGDKIRGRKIELKKIGVKRGAEKIEIELKSTPQ